MKKIYAISSKGADASEDCGFILFIMDENTGLQTRNLQKSQHACGFFALTAFRVDATIIPLNHCLV